ncbi:MAG: hypothetical protein SGI88_18115 [Candidatus Hydrogenedentes bacterium]|nr:hypothetical protein [Candidatus Hydrogenedentota bacterium]
MHHGIQMFRAVKRYNVVLGVLVAAALVVTPHHAAIAGSNLADGGFEAGRFAGVWKEASTNFDTPICSFAVCGDGSGTAEARSGSFWAWFGGSDDNVEKAKLQQNVRFPSGGNATLQFYLWIGDSSPDGKDWLRVFIDGDRVFNVKESSNQYDDGYTLVSIDVSAYADGAKHKLLFKNKCTGDGNSNFNLDDVSITD